MKTITLTDEQAKFLSEILREKESEHTSKLLDMMADKTTYRMVLERKVTRWEQDIVNITYAGTEDSLRALIDSENGNIEYLSEQGKIEVDYLEFEPNVGSSQYLTPEENGGAEVHEIVKMEQIDLDNA